ncbi:hypothetical protein [Segetibacter koreensis]|uniref:hypothetical protein n=1 Tax=Segetibacter koreensis TaxID=398037 RepID=UPI000363AFA3|nr:hypothetical protein [Segetibacter koreensis]
MSSFPILDLVVGMIFIYFLLSIISSSAVEMILTGLNIRSRVLKEWLVTIFDTKIKKTDGSETTLGQEIMDHCAVTVLTKKGIPPSYIDARNFTSALLERITYDPKNPKSIATNLDEIIAALNNTAVLSVEMQRALLGYAYEAKNTYAAISKKSISEVEYFRHKVEQWYDTSMDRVSGTLKIKYARPFTFIVAVLAAGLLNADSIAISKYLYSNPDARARLAEQAYSAAKDTTYMSRLTSVQRANNDPVTTATIEKVKADIKKSLENMEEAKAALESTIPLGWNKNELKHDGKYAPSLIFKKITGLAATIFAIFMGAPFWFDLLNKVTNLRGTGPKPSSSTNEDDDKKK